MQFGDNIWKKIVGIITFSDYAQESSRALFESENIEILYKIKTYLMYVRAILLYLYHHNNLPVHFNNLFTRNENIHIYDQHQKYILNLKETIMEIFPLGIEEQ